MLVEEKGVLTKNLEFDLIYFQWRKDRKRSLQALNPRLLRNGGMTILNTLRCNFLFLSFFFPPSFRFYLVDFIRSFELVLVRPRIQFQATFSFLAVFDGGFFLMFFLSVIY